jgi:hypothetical protein
VLNDFETREKTKAFADFILRYHDERIMKVMNEILPYRQQFLGEAGLLDATNAHIATQIAAAQSFDEELVALICIKYMYFVRNKSVHGERFDRIIGVGNKETAEVKWLNTVLERLIIDLINVSDLYE